MWIRKIDTYDSVYTNVYTEICLDFNLALKYFLYLHKEIAMFVVYRFMLNFSVKTFFVKSASFDLISIFVCIPQKTEVFAKNVIWTFEVQFWKKYQNV